MNFGHNVEKDNVLKYDVDYCNLELMNFYYFLYFLN